MSSSDAASAGQASECQLCPLCQAMAALRSARPEAVEHLLKAGAELLLAARALLEGGPGGAEPGAGDEPRAGDGRSSRPRPARPRGRGAAAPASDGLQHIDVG